jgi:hypothetical protein
MPLTPSTKWTAAATGGQQAVFKMQLVPQAW